MSENREKGRRTRTRLAVLAMLLLLLVGVGWLGWRVYRVWGAAAALRADAQDAMALVDEGPQQMDPQVAISVLHTTRDDLQALEAAARPFLRLAPLAGWVPRYGPTIQAAPAMLDMALDLAEAGETMVDAMVPVLGDDEGGSDEGSLVGEATAALAEARPELEQALAAVREAETARERMDAEALDPRLRDWMGRLDRYLPLLEEGLRGAIVAPELLGAERPRTYLLLVQNEDELRATGGFISGVAKVRVDEGRIDDVVFEDSYAVDDFSQPYPEPPEPLQELMLAGLWVFRDSNWSPDFPTSARKAVELYNVGRDAEIHGVVALDQQGISMLLGPLGPLEVEGAGERVTGQNVLQVARQAWAPGEETKGDWWRHRKDIMGSVFDGAIRRLQTGMDREQMVGLGYAALQAMRERHLLLYVEDREAAAALREVGWDGALARSDGDYVMVVDSNVGFNKVNGVVEERLDYSVDLSDLAQPRATLTVHHRHPIEDWSGPCSQKPRYSPTYAGMTERCYFDYMRVLVPAGAELLGATPHSVPGDILVSDQRQPGRVDVSAGEGAKTVFATFFVMRPAQTLSTTFSYALPEGTIRHEDGTWRYELTVQKQPGTDTRPTTITMRLPAGAEVTRESPDAAQRDGSVLIYRTALRTDFRLSVAWRQGELP